jgi:hypothetical protein
MIRRFADKEHEDSLKDLMEKAKTNFKYFKNSLESISKNTERIGSLELVIMTSLQERIIGRAFQDGMVRSIM